MSVIAMPNNLNSLRRSGVGRCRPQGVEDEIDVIEDFEDSTRARRPSDAAGIVLSNENIDRFRDILIVKLRRSRISFRNLGRVLNISHEAVRLRYNAIPHQTRRYYEQVQLG